jgi:hypothetical protein
MRYRDEEDSGLLPGTETNGSSKRERETKNILLSKEKGPNPSLAKPRKTNRIMVQDLDSLYKYFPSL